MTREKIILEPTSGNTGIALAMLGTAKGYRVKLVMPACVSIERRSVLEAYGAEVVLSPAEEATDGAIRLAHRILDKEPDKYFMPNQYANPHNVLAHYETTGPGDPAPGRRPCRCICRGDGDFRDTDGGRPIPSRA